jgi:Ca2+-binding RTX toxin-like protein
MASSYGWMFASPGDWSSIDNWQDVDLGTNGLLPTVDDDAFVMGAAAIAISAGESFQVLDLNLANYFLPGSSAIGTPEILLQSGTLTVGGNVYDAYTVAGYVPEQYVPGGGTPPISVSGGGTIALAGGTINGFLPGDAIDLAGIPAAGATETYDQTTQHISISSNGVPVADFKLTGNGYSTDNFNITDDGNGNAKLSAAPSAPMFYVWDTNSNSLGWQGGTALPTGSLLSGAYTYLGSDNILVAAGTPSVWIVGGSGNDVLAVAGGNNLVDGGSGANILVGGNGNDTFFMSPTDTTPTWDFLENFHPGDLLVIWGWKLGETTWSWAEPDNSVPGFAGETLTASLNGDGNPNAAVTFIGATSSDKLTMFQGPSGGVPYALIYNSG